MSQNISWLGNDYPDVPYIQLPKTGGGVAQFDDTAIDASVAAAASDIASGKQAVVNGVLLTGTASGGGGASPWTHILTHNATVNTTSTTASTVVTIAGHPAISTADKIVWVHIRDTQGARAGYFYGSDAFFVNYNIGSGSTTTFSVPAVICMRYNNGTYSGTAGQYGVYGYSISSTGSLTIRKRYNSSYSLTINSTYKIDVYTLDLPDALTLFDN